MRRPTHQAVTCPKSRKALCLETWWLHDEVGHNQEAKKKSSNCLARIRCFRHTKAGTADCSALLTIATNPGDLVLDSFAGSGTTGAVAHKMGRRWIMVELGEHCHTHIIPRLKKVIDGEDKGGVTEAAGWKGGGGFRYYRLGAFAPPEGRVRQLGHQQGVQPGHAGRGHVQAGRLHLRPQRHGLLAARPFHGDGLHLRDHADLDPRAVAEALGRGRRRPYRFSSCAARSA